MALDDVQILDDIMTQFGGQFVGATIDSVTTSGTATVAANAAWTADTTQSLITHTGDDLAAGDTIQVVFTATIDPDVSGASTSGLDNQASSTGTGINPDTGVADPTLAASDVSDNGTDPTTENGADENADGTFGNDPTPIIIPDISVAKEVVSTTPNGDNFDVVYQLVVENTGNVDLADVSLIDDLATQFGGAFVSAGSPSVVTAPTDVDSSITIDAAWDGDANAEIIDQSVTTNLLKVGDSFVVQITVTVDPDATGTSGPLNNQATAGGDAVDDMGNPLTNAAGDPIVTTDLSDSGSDPNGTNPGGDGDTGGSNDPTPLAIPDLRVAKQANTVEEVAGLTGVFDVTYLVVIENTGTIELTDLQITDDVAALSNFGDAYDPSAITGPTDRSGLVAAPTIVSNTLADASDLPTLNAAFVGGATQTDIFDGMSGALQVGEQITVSYTVRIDNDELLNPIVPDTSAGNVDVSEFLTLSGDAS